MKSHRIIHLLRTGALILLLLLICYVMVHHIGLIDQLDFGAGAYYYADIPGFSKLINRSHYTTTTPMWVLITLFLIWGYVMYRLWVWIEKKGQHTS